MQIPTDIWYEIFDYIHPKDLVRMRAISKQVNQVAMTTLGSTTTSEIQFYHDELNEQRLSHQILEERVMPEIENNLSFVEDDHSLEITWHHLNRIKDPLGLKVLRCLYALFQNYPGFTGKLTRLQFMNMIKNIDYMDRQIIDTVEDTILKDGITYEKARVSSPICFRLLILIAACLEVFKLRKALNNSAAISKRLENRLMYYTRVRSIL